MSEINAENILRDANLVASVTHKLVRQHKKALKRKGVTSQTILPSFELCLKKGCKEIDKHYDLKTHKFIYPLKYCDKLINYTQKANTPKTTLVYSFTQRDLNLICVALESSKLDERLLLQLKTLSQYAGVRVTTS